MHIGHLALPTLVCKCDRKRTFMSRAQRSSPIWLDMDESDVDLGSYYARALTHFGPRGLSNAGED
ncbi:hypothetical protein MPTK1_3g16935 [Marchantia polymorpha subsp. ruderalis]